MNELRDLVEAIERQLKSIRESVSRERQRTGDADLQRARLALDKIADLLTRARDAGTVPRW